MNPSTIPFRRNLLLAGVSLLALPACAIDRDSRKHWSSIHVDPVATHHGQIARVEHVGHRDRRDHSHRDDRDDRDDRRPAHRHHHFQDHHRVVVTRYYTHEYRHGHCPPGLARKHNGCRPPGHVKHWQMGRPLAHGIQYHEVPPALVVQLGAPPRGYRYVRVASDILLIAIGTSIVVDAIEDLIR